MSILSDRFAKDADFADPRFLPFKGHARAVLWSTEVINARYPCMLNKKIDANQWTNSRRRSKS